MSRRRSRPVQLLSSPSTTAVPTTSNGVGLRIRSADMGRLRKCAGSVAGLGAFGLGISRWSVISCKAVTHSCSPRGYVSSVAHVVSSSSLSS